ncbi:hybrid sensor histidine kinase/response regulator [Chitinophaga barathri]|nr:hybrid sensor histidine kinase/response regulator [Chitinophaga barathri]
MTHPALTKNKFLLFWRRQISAIINAGADSGNTPKNKRTRVINISSLIAASLVFFFGGGLTIFSGSLAILYPAVPETLMFTGAIWLNYKRKYFYSALLWHMTFCTATLIFGIMLSTVIDATHMAGYLIGAPLLIFKQKETKLLAACVTCSILALVGIELNNNLHFFQPLDVSTTLYPVFRVATWLTVILLNVVVILFYLQQNNLLIGKLKQANAKLNKVNKKLAKASAYKTVYVNETTHELRAPLNALYAISQLLDDDSITGEDLQKMHKSMGYSISHALEIINNVLELAKIESGKTVPLKIERMVIRNWLEDITRVFTYQAAYKKVNIELRFEDDLPSEINFPRVQVTQVLNNLLSNAIKFTTDGSLIQVSAGCKGDTWFLSVKDNGIGMNKVTLEKIFVPFFTSGSNNPTGTGLGMHIAKKITERLGGSLVAESEWGKGSRFTASFRLNMEESPALSPADDPSSLIHPAKVLIIDDDFMGTHYYSKILGKMGCVVSVAYTGEFGLRAAELHRPDIVIMDMSLPDKNGKELLQEFKRHPDLSNIPIVFFTGSQLAEDQETAMRLGAEEYLLKPVQVDAINRILSKYAPEQ